MFAGEIVNLLGCARNPFFTQIMSNLSAYVCEVIEKIAANVKGNNKVP